MGKIDADEADEVLIEKWKRGDRQAGGRLLQPYIEDLRAYFVGEQVEDVDELVQSTLLACVESAHRFRGDSSFRTYVLRIARYQMYRCYRKQCARQEVTLAEPPEASSRDTRHDRDLLLGNVVGKLPDELREVLALSYGGELTQKEIAEYLSIPAGTVASRLRRARESLRVLLQPGALVELAGARLSDASGKG